MQEIKNIEAAQAANPPLPERFYYRPGDGALMYEKRVKDDEIEPVKICPHVEFKGRTYGEQWGYLLQFQDGLGRLRRIAIPARLFQINGAEWAGILADSGMDVEPGQQRLFMQCCMAIKDRLPLVQNVAKVGWTYQDAHGLPSYVLPDSVYSAGNDSSIVFQSGMGAMPSLYTQAGTLEGWKELAALCTGNTRLIFALCVAFAGPLLHLAGIDGGIFNFEGASSGGKSTALRVAASVWGNPDNHMRTWRTTDNGLEAVAPLFNDNMLTLDELGQVGARALSETAYMIANGSGKSRAARNGTARNLATWRTAILSSGELNLAAKLAEEGLDVKAGQLVRFIGIPLMKEHLADLHGMDAGELIVKLNSLSRLHYGMAGRMYLQALVNALGSNKENLQARLRTKIDETAAQWIPKGADPQVMRIAKRFALVMRAGLFAQYASILPPEMDIHGAIKSCLDDWLKERGSIGEQETAAILDHVKTFIERHGQSRFQDSKYPDQTVINRAGFKEDSLDGLTYFVFTGVFKSEVIKGFSVKQAVNVLKRAGWLITQSGGHNTINKRLPGMDQTRVYAIRIIDGGGEV